MRTGSVIVQGHMTGKEWPPAVRPGLHPCALLSCSRLLSSWGLIELHSLPPSLPLGGRLAGNTHFHSLTCEHAVQMECLVGAERPFISNTTHGPAGSGPRSVFPGLNYYIVLSNNPHPLLFCHFSGQEVTLQGNIFCQLRCPFIFLSDLSYTVWK